MELGEWIGGLIIEYSDNRGLDNRGSTVHGKCQIHWCICHSFKYFCRYIFLQLQTSFPTLHTTWLPLDTAVKVPLPACLSWRTGLPPTFMDQCCMGPPPTKVWPEQIFPVQVSGNSPEYIYLDYTENCSKKPIHHSLSCPPVSPWYDLAIVLCLYLYPEQYLHVLQDIKVLFTPLNCTSTVEITKLLTLP